MKPLLLLHLVACFACLASAQNVTVQQFDGGSMVVGMGKDGVLNEGSALKRSFLVANDSSCPVQLSGLGVEPRYVSDGDFVFRLVGTATARESISAAEIAFVLFDLWGARIRNLSALTVTEVSSGSDMPRGSTWEAGAASARLFMTSVAYVRQVRTPDGRIWKADTRAVLDKLSSGPVGVSAQDLESFSALPIAVKVKPAPGTPR